MTISRDFLLDLRDQGEADAADGMRSLELLLDGRPQARAALEEAWRIRVASFQSGLAVSDLAAGRFDDAIPPDIMPRR